ncbi:hypothetical protein SBBP1_530078 [Burkholderiales bacterium]|nr:hypothetical protein SBBP1_530078 [Burkholderiales bacterium]
MLAGEIVEPILGEDCTSVGTSPELRRLPIPPALTLVIIGGSACQLRRIRRQLGVTVAARAGFGRIQQRRPATLIRKLPIDAMLASACHPGAALVSGIGREVGRFDGDRPHWRLALRRQETNAALGAPMGRFAALASGRTGSTRFSGLPKCPVQHIAASLEAICGLPVREPNVLRRSELGNPAGERRFHGAYSLARPKGEWHRKCARQYRKDAKENSRNCLGRNTLAAIVRVRFSRPSSAPQAELIPARSCHDHGRLVRSDGAARTDRLRRCSASGRGRPTWQSIRRCWDSRMPA